MAPWLQATQSIAAIATTIGVLIALYVAVIREPRKAADERRRHEAQVAALRRAAHRRVVAQARKVVPSCQRAPMRGRSSWTVLIDNTSDAVTTILAVDVMAVDCGRVEVPDGCRRVNGMVGHSAMEWQRTLPPRHHIAMAYTTTKPEYGLRVTIDYEDDAGHQWRRTDGRPPTPRGEDW